MDMDAGAEKAIRCSVRGFASWKKENIVHASPNIVRLQTPTLYVNIVRLQKENIVHAY